MDIREGTEGMEGKERGGVGGDSGNPSEVRSLSQVRTLSQVRRLERTITRIRARKLRGDDPPEALEKLLDQVRHDLDVAVNRRMAEFEGDRSEAALCQVMARVEESRRRGAWVMRTFRALTAMGASLWNSRAIRMLVP